MASGDDFFDNGLIVKVEEDELYPELFPGGTSAIKTEEVDIGLEEVKLEPGTRCYLCPEVVGNGDELLPHLLKAHPAYKYHCVECKFSVSSPQHFHSHQMLHETMPYRCGKCPLRFASELQRGRHEQGHDGNGGGGTSYSRVAEEYKYNRVLPCAVCGKKFSTEFWLKRHELAVHQIDSKKHQCPTCSKLFVYEHMLRAHVQSKHSDKKNINDLDKCYLCEGGITMESGDALREHLSAQHTKEGRHDCDQCKYSSRKVWDFNKHLSRHDYVLRPFKCRFCFVGFSKNIAAKTHEGLIHYKELKKMAEAPADEKVQQIVEQTQTIVRVVQDEQNDDPEVDLDAALPGFAIQAPDMTETEEVPLPSETPPGSATGYVAETFKCYLCTPNVVLPGKNSLENHLSREHPSQEKYECSFCEISIPDKSTFNRHLSRHDTDLRPFKCSFCPLRFVQPDGKSRHEAKIHRIQSTNGKLTPTAENACATCGKIYVAKTQLKHHVCKEQPRYKCYLCTSDTETLFATSELLKQHLQESHRSSSLYRCTQCRYSSTKKYYFNSHHASHDPTRNPHKCDFCSLHFPSIEHKVRHQTESHSNAKQKQAIRKFPCPTCGRKYAYMRKLNIHLKTTDCGGPGHQQKKSKTRYTCSTCGKTFASAATMKKHQETKAHSGVTETPVVEEDHWCKFCVSSSSSRRGCSKGKGAE